MKQHWVELYTVQDVNEQTWDVYQEQFTKIPLELKILKGFPTGKNPTNSIYTRAVIILTPALAEYLKQHSALNAAKTLGISLGTVQKFRKALHLNKTYLKKDPQWLLQHQEEILTAPVEVLKTKYGISAPQIATLVEWLNDLTRPEKNSVARLSLDEYKERYPLDETVMKIPQSKQSKQEKNKNWFIAHQDLIFSTCLTVDEIAQRLNKTPQQILKARESLRRYSNTLSAKNRLDTWLTEHQDILLSKASMEEIAQRLNISRSLVISYRAKLRKQRNLSSKKQSMFTRNVSEQDKALLLSNEMSVEEIAMQLGRSKAYVTQLQAWLKNPEQKSPKQQRDDWILEHQKELQYLSPKMLSEKYNIAAQTVYGYRKRLFTLLTSEYE